MRTYAKKLLIGLLVMLVTLAAMVLLPQDAYTRWQSMQVEAYARLGWIYERIHYDPTPIDIAFIGTSHTMMGVDAGGFQNDLNGDGVRTAEGKCIHAVNLAIPSYGRDLHWEIARELLENRPVKVIVLEVFENETRKAHPLFVHVAETRDILTAPMLINLGYFHNLIRLPFRQLSLFVKSAFPQWFGLKQRFDPADYDGSDVDNTRVINVNGAALSPYRDHVMPDNELVIASELNKRDKNLHMMGAWASSYEYSVPNFYVKALLDLAAEKRVDVVFLYLPQYGMANEPVEKSLFEGRGDWIYANDILKRKDYWFDEAHLNAQGARELTDRISSEFLLRWQRSNARMESEDISLNAGTAACEDTGYPSRVSLKPFSSTKPTMGEQ